MSTQKVETPVEVKAMVTKQTVLINKIEKLITNGKKRNLDQRTLGFYQTKQKELTTLWEEFDKRDTELQQILVEKQLDKTEPYQVNDLYAIIEKKYSDYASDIQDGIAEKSVAQNQMLNTTFTDSTLPTTTSTPTRPTLPRINLPTFAGDYNDWQSFHDLFISIVHNNVSIPAVQKLHYLKGCLTGEASQLLKSIPVTDEDYQPAWNKLKARYENKKLLINMQLKKLFASNKLSVESSKSIRTLKDNAEESIQQLKTLKISHENWWNLSLIYLLEQNLPYTTMKLWEEEQGKSVEQATIQDFLEFLEKRAKLLETIASTVTSTTLSKSVVRTATKSYLAQYQTPKRSGGQVQNKCPMCNASHYVANCEQFLKLKTGERKEFLIKTNRCFNCFSNKHGVQHCLSTYTCRRCNKKHHTLLHEEQIKNTARVQETTGAINHSQVETRKAFFNIKNKNAILATLQANIVGKGGKLLPIRCLVDPGSETSFITTSCYQQLGLKGSPTMVEISGLNKNKTAWAKTQLSIDIQSKTNQTQQTNVTCLVIKSITTILPTKTIKVSNTWKHFDGITLADPLYWQPGAIDMLLGVEFFTKVLAGNIKRGCEDDPIAVETSFGWIIMGKGPIDRSINVFHTKVENTDNLNIQLQRFWELEEIDNKPMLSIQDTQCENYFNQTHKRLKNGQYQVKLPFVNSTGPSLGNSRNTALKRFQYLQSKLRNDETLNCNYSQCLNEYAELKHMTPIQTNDDQNTGYYIPHHAVMKESSTTKLRVVFDASAKTTNNKSLNQQLLVGPTLQPKLFSTLLKWRKYKVAITADIEKMYRMILVHPEDRKYQKIIWINAETNKIQDFELNTVTFGTSSAPYLAIKTLQQLAVDEQNQWPVASKNTNYDFYVDDLLTGADSVQEVHEIKNQYIEMLNAGHFKLRKWSSSHQEVLNGLPTDYLEVKDNRPFSEYPNVKTLGINWIPSKDQFTFVVKQRDRDNAWTKRTILSEIASLYDPLGWVAPVIIRAKILMQQLWISGCSWDEPTLSPLTQQWIRFRQELPQLALINIPRWLGSQSNTTIQLHGFADASNVAYAAVIYIVINDGTTTKCQLVTAKTKVAPLKPITIPRLELNGAVLLSKLLVTAQQSLQLGKVDVFAWTDSTIALHWIKNHPSKWKVYVANRVVEIQDKVPPDKWHHVPTNHNPADIASRGLHASELLTNEMWWTGPSWLCQSMENWPHDLTHIDSNTPLEAKTIKTITLINCDDSESILAKYSNFDKLQRIICWIMRFKNRQQSPRLHLNELKQATNIICKLIQTQNLKEEYYDIIKNKSLITKNKLSPLTPFIDANGVMRVGGRLTQAQLSYEQMHPIIIPAEHPVTDLIIEKYHKETLHGGMKLTTYAIHQSFWIVNGKRAISKKINKCVTCIRYRNQQRLQLMGSLPKARVTMAKPFTNVGIDYAGPINFKTSAHRSKQTYKGYFCVFVCMSTKAVHLEAVSDLTTAGFLAALRRFVARRGQCSNIYSDCGTNFKGAKRELNKELTIAIKNATSEVAKNYLLNNHIQWHFNPPLSPHFGGLWEAVVKSTKYHLKRIVGQNIYTYEQYATLLTQVEACLNSRPLCPLNNNIEDLEVLTPSHLIMGYAMKAIPIECETSNGTSHQQKWKHIQYLLQHFWKKWHVEYLNQLMHRPKWLMKTNNIEVGSLVLIKDENHGPSIWPLGRVQHIHPGDDGKVRVVDIKTQTSILRRPIAKLIVLPIETD